MAGYQRKKNWTLDFYALALGLAQTKPNSFKHALDTEQWKRDVLTITDSIERSRKNFDRTRFLVVAEFLTSESEVQDAWKAGTQEDAVRSIHANR